MPQTASVWNAVGATVYLIHATHLPTVNNTVWMERRGVFIDWSKHKAHLILPGNQIY